MTEEQAEVQILRSTETRSAESVSTEIASTKLARGKTKYQAQDDFIRVDFTSANASTELRQLLPPLPPDRASRSEWFGEVAREATLSVAQVRSLGSDVAGLRAPFRSLISGQRVAASLERSQSGEIVCRDRSAAGTECVYTTLPALFASTISHTCRRLPRNQHIEWRVRLLANANLIDLPAVRLPGLPAGLCQHVLKVYEDLRVLFGCRWFLEPGEPVPFTASFIEGWCGVSTFQARDARDALRQYGVIREAGALRSGRPFPTKLFIPGAGT
jgi:hypothetical protein